METQNRTENLSQYPFISAVISAFFLLTCIVIGLTVSEKAGYSVSGVFVLFLENPVFFPLLIFSLLVPVSVYLISVRISRQLKERQQMIDLEQYRMQRINKFAQELIHDNLEVDFSRSGDDDILGNSLISLRDTLRVNKENSLKFRAEEERRNWISEGLARISTILRNNLQDPEQLAFNVIKELTKYINAIQGGFYILDDTDPQNRFFNLLAFFAYDRRKFADQQIKWGDGLVGTCAMEQKVIHLKSIPESYISVTSGLGEANPSSLLIVPIQYENSIYGVLEFATFNKFEATHITMIEQAAESIASTLAAVNTNITTKRLLEESKAQTEALTSHEEEMRQNMEELQATQEEATRQAQRFMQLEETLNQSLIRAEFNSEGRFLSANNLFFNKFGYPPDSAIQGKSIHDFISEDTLEQFRETWKKLKKSSIPFSGYLKHATLSGNDLWTMSSIVAIRNEEDRTDKFIFLAMDTSHEVLSTRKNTTLSELADKQGIRFELDIHGNFKDYNPCFMQMLKSSQKELKSMGIFDLIDPADLETFNKQWDSITGGTASTGVFRIRTVKGEEKWMNGSFAGLYNMAHEISRILFTGFDASNEKSLETELKIKSESLRKLEKILRDAEKDHTKQMRETRTDLQNRLKETERLKSIHEWIVNDSPDAIVTIGHDNRILFFNQAAEKLWKVNRNEVISQDVSVLFPEKLTDEDELLGSFTRPGDQKITGKRKQTVIIDHQGKEKQVEILLEKTRVDGENAFVGFFKVTGDE
jgi:PAS domain S-box-containing protein